MIWPHKNENKIIALQQMPLDNSKSKIYLATLIKSAHIAWHCYLAKDYLTSKVITTNSQLQHIPPTEMLFLPEKENDKN